jgi:hypothetical protein
MTRMKKRDFLGEGKQLLCVKEEGDGGDYD